MSVVCRPLETSANSWIIGEIKAMMHGFGDWNQPLPESVKIMHEILRQQMNELLSQTCRNAVSRSGRFIGMQDILLVMTKDRVKLSRLIKYLCLKDLKTVALQGADGDKEDESSHPVEVRTDGDLASPTFSKIGGKRRRLCEEFLSTVDQTGELLAILETPAHDDVKLERDLRMDHQSRQMNTAQYIEFTEARQASFRRKCKVNKFRDWLLEDKTLELLPNAMAMEIFSYLAYETVGQVVDLALLVKKDADPVRADVACHGFATKSYNQDYPLIWLPRQEDPVMQANSPGIQGPAAPPTKTMKNKMSRLGPDSRIPCNQAIQPGDIQEAIRRYYQQAGPMAPLGKVCAPQLGRRLLAC